MRLKCAMLSIDLCIFLSLIPEFLGFEDLTTDSPRQRALSQFPLNEAVLAGDTASLRCWASAPPPESRIQWTEFTWSGSDGAIVSDGQDVLSENGRYDIVHYEPTQFNLEIRWTVLMDGGTYLCEDVNDDPSNRYRGQAELIVLDGEPRCTSTIPSDGIVLEGQHHTIDCSVGFRGNIAPSMTWSTPYNSNMKYTTTTGIRGNQQEGADTLWSRLSFYVDRDNHIDYGIFQCRTNFISLGEYEPMDNAAANLPTYSHVYRTNSFHISYDRGPTNVRLYWLQENYYVDDWISCYADAQPSATFYWQNMRTLSVTEGSFFHVTEDMAHLTTLIRCQAQNTFAGYVFSDHLLVNITVLGHQYYYYGRSFLTHGQIAGIVIGSLVATVLLIGITCHLFAVFRRRRRSRNSSPKKEDRVAIANDFETPQENPNYVAAKLPSKPSATMEY